jgi:hypothetical protein
MKTAIQTLVAIVVCLIPLPAAAEYCSTTRYYEAIPVCAAPGCIAGRTVRIRLAEVSSCQIQPCRTSDYQLRPCDHFRIEFGDGTSTIVSGQSSVDHVYAAPGAYEVKVVNLINADGNLEDDDQRTTRRIHIAPEQATFIGVDENRTTARESDGSISVTLVRDGLTDRESTVNYNLRDSKSSHYANSGTIVFPVGATERTLTLPIANDSVYRPIDYRLRLQTPGAFVSAGYSPYDREISIVTVDDEPAPLLSVEDIRITEGDEGLTLATITVRKSLPTAHAEALIVNPLGRAAKDDVDFFGYTPDVIIPAGAANAELSVYVIGDTDVETSEDFVLSLVPSSGAAAPFVLARNEVRVTIADDDSRFVDGDIRAPAGSQTRLTLRVSEQNAPRTVTLTSSNVSIAAVPSSLVVPAGALLVPVPLEAKQFGSAVIRASSAEGTAEARVTVFDLLTPLFDETDLRLAPGTRTSVRLTTAPLRSAPLFASITSSDPEVVAVVTPVEIASGSGGVTLEARNPGTATITATLPANAGGTSVTMTVTVASPTRRRPR